MKRLILIAAFTLAACGQPPSPHATTPISTVTSANVTPSAVVSGLSQDFLVGRWGDSGDCNKDIVFNADGTFRSYNGGGGQYSVSGDIITMSGEGGVFQLQAKQIDARTLELTNPDGAVFTSQRC